MVRRYFIAGLLVLEFAVSASAQKIHKETIESLGNKRTYYLVVPDNVTAERPAPLLVVLHGSNRNGLSLVEKWKDLARKEGFFLVGPDARNSRGWSAPADGPDFLNELISDLKSKHPIDNRRMYLFGHSAGATFALYMSLYESEYFAATAVHAGALSSDAGSIMELAKRKIPIYIAVGTADAFFPLTVVRATRDMLNKNGFNAQLVEMKGHDHWYYDLAPKINAEAWSFLKMQKLTEDPRYTQYSFK
jgi:poly(3-hydroxybutyrate) depolymerase